MSTTESIKSLGQDAPKTRKWFKKNLSRRRRSAARQDPENAGTRNRSGIKGWAD